MKLKLAVIAGFLLVGSAAVYAQDKEGEKQPPAAQAQPVGDEAAPPEMGLPPAGPMGDMDDEDMPKAVAAKAMHGREAGEKGSHGKMMMGGKERLDNQKGGPFAFPGMDKVIEQIRQLNSTLADRLEALRKDKVHLFHAVMRNEGPKLFFAAMGDKESRAKMVTEVGLEIDVVELTQTYQDASAADKDAVKKKLEAKLSQQFDAKLALDQARIDDLSKELSKLKTRVEKRKSQKSDLVKKRLGEITGETESW